jgi:8-oxo-dGTP pyrophosphatase MutT (NUDIX family)
MNGGGSSGGGFTIPADLEQRLESLDDLPAPLHDLRHAAVLALILRDSPHEPDPRLLLIERSGALRSHAGQLAFPGGKPEPQDATLMDTALREAEEEVGLDRNAPHVVGRLDPVPTPTGFMIVPYVAWAPVGFEPRGTSPEVHRVLTPSLAQLADPSIHRITGRGVWLGFHYELHEFSIHQPPLWGATARMVWDLLERIGKR